MKQEKFYAVKNGRKIGIYRTWEECKEQVDGFSAAEYKSFQTEEEAKNYVFGISDYPVSSCEAVAYTDGSYSAEDERFSFGIVLFIGEEKLTFNKAYPKSELSSMRNVAGEIKGAASAMQYCIKRGIKSLEIFYDYEGVEKWCTGEWKTNKAGTAGYKMYYDSIKDKLSVKFTKVKGHSGNKFNDEADSLAKNALGIK